MSPPGGARTATFFATDIEAAAALVEDLLGTVAGLRGALDHAALDRAWAEGRDMTVPAAVDLAASG